jgi:hypothetical protein
MKKPVSFRLDNSEGVRVTIGPVYAELDRDAALEVWTELGRKLGILCESHRLEGEKVSAAKCSRCNKLVELVDDTR